MSNELLSLSIGKDVYASLVDNNCYYVDKTPLLKTCFKDDSSQVLLITRPRRFGKTLTMSMFSSFLGINYDNPMDLSRHQELFKNREILKDKDFCEKFMGKYPVIFISFKSVAGKDFYTACSELSEVINLASRKLTFLLDSDKLDEFDKQDFRALLDAKLMRDEPSKITLKKSLQKLTIFLYKHFKQKCILLIDEYDVPLAKASSCDYYSDMVELIRSMFDSALKSNDDYLQKAVLTGCLRVSKESIFTGMNNLSVNTIYSTDPDFATGIGFTKEETEIMLDYYGLGDYKSLVKANYDGYNFNNNEMYCAWDVVCFCKDAKKDLTQNNVIFRNYWTDTSSNQIVADFLDYLTPSDADKMQTLIDGGCILEKVRVDMSYEDLKNHTSNDFWSLLAYTGYLTVAMPSNFNVDKEPLQFKLPNASVKDCFMSKIKDYYEANHQQLKNASAITKAALLGNTQELKNEIKKVLQRYISVRDFSRGNIKEYYYHAFLNGYFSTQTSAITNYSSNVEAGDGFADISFEADDVAVIIEIKQTDSPENIVPKAQEALSQIKDKKYYQFFITKDPEKTVLCYGISFCKKDCYVVLDKICTKD